MHESVQTLAHPFTLDFSAFYKIAERTLKLLQCVGYLPLYCWLILELLRKHIHWRIWGRARRKPPSHGSRFFRFNIQNFRNVTTSGVNAPTTRSTPPYGKSWIRHGHHSKIEFEYKFLVLNACKWALLCEVNI